MFPLVVFEIPVPKYSSASTVDIDENAMTPSPHPVVNAIQDRSLHKNGNINNSEHYSKGSPGGTGSSRGTVPAARMYFPAQSDCLAPTTLDREILLRDDRNASMQMVCSITGLVSFSDQWQAELGWFRRTIEADQRLEGAGCSVKWSLNRAASCL